MLTKVSYSVEKKNVTDQYIDFELTFNSDVDKVSFSFYYRLSGEERWHDDAILQCSQSSTQSGNLLSSVSLDSGICNLRWLYCLNGVEFKDSIQIEIRPEPYIESFIHYEDKTSAVKLDLYGVSDVSILSEKRFSEDTYVIEDKLYYSGNLIFSGLSFPSCIDTYIVVGIKRFLVADTGNSRILEINEYGTTVSTYSYSGFIPVYCSYDEVTGYVLFVDSDSKDVKEIYWKDVSSGNPDSNLGVVIWDYNAEFPTYPLTNPVASTYGVDNDVVITDGSVIKIDRDEGTRTIYSSFKFRRSVGDQTENSYVPNTLFSSYEIDKNKFIAFETSGNVLSYTNSELSNITYNRALRDAANMSIPMAFSNALFYPISPILKSDDINVTIGLLNGEELQKSVYEAYVADQRKAFSLDGVSDSDARGDVLNNYPKWGVVESYNQGHGSQSLVCMTGQTLNVSLPFYSKRVGYEKSLDGIDPIYVKENIQVNLVDAFTGISMSYCVINDFDSSTTFSIPIPGASAESYLRSKIYGVHGFYFLNIEVTESYYYDNEFKNEADQSKTFKFYIPIYTFWWRQVFKEIQISGSPVTNFSFVLEDYTEPPAYFFNNYTVYPSYYRTVGTTTLSLTDMQKEKIILDNAFALLSYYVGFSSGDSPISNIFGFNPALYEAPKSETVTNLYKVDPVNRTSISNLPGLNSEYQSINIFDNYPGVGCVCNQFLKDIFVSLVSESSYLFGKWQEGGLVTFPFFGNTVSTNITTLIERKRLSIDIDLPILSVDSILVKGGYYNDDRIQAGEENITVSFTTSSTDIQEVTIGVSVDDGEYVTYTDPTGDMRSCILSSPKDIVSTSVIHAMIELTDSTDNKFTYYAIKRVENHSKATSVSNVTVSYDRLGKRLFIQYDLNSKYQFVPYTVKLYLSSVNGLITEVTNYAEGDINQVFSGVSKLIILNYNELPGWGEDTQRESWLIIMEIVPFISGESNYQVSFCSNFRTPNLVDNLITEETAVTISKEDGGFKPVKIISESYVYNPNPLTQGQIYFSNSSIGISFSSSSTSSSSSSSLSSSSNSSSSISQSSHSSSSSSSSS